MSKKKKPKKPRSKLVVDMITNCKGGPMRNKKSKRKKTKASKIEEIEKEYK